MKKLFKFEKNKTYFGLDVYPSGVKLNDINKLPFAQFFNDSHVGSTMVFIDDENYVYIHDWERFCKSFIEYGKHRYSIENKYSRLYANLIEVLNGIKIDSLKVGVSSKTILKKLIDAIEKDESGELKKDLLEMKNLTVSKGKEILIQVQGKNRKQEFKREMKEDKIKMIRRGYMQTNR